MIKQFYILFLVVLLSACGENEPYEDAPMADDPLEETLEVDVALNLEIPDYFPDLTYDLSQNPPTQNGFVLGKKLFYDGRLASDGVVSCGFCHIQAFAFTHHTHITSHGVNGAIGKRNAQPLHNLAFMEEFTWDGAAGHLDAQPIIPITAEVEMNNSFNNIVTTLSQDPEYVEMFAAAFENGQIDPDNILKALSQFMLMMVSADSKYDRFLRNDGTTLTTDETAGLGLFEAKCSSCHSGVLQTDQTYRNNGLSIDPEFNDVGRFRVTGQPSDSLKFKVPSLRNIEATFPYMHDGRIPDLEAVLDHYSDGIVDSPTLDPLLRNADGSLGIPLTEAEKAQIIAFLKTLTDDNFIFDERFAEF
ncbi:cytochrome-c peroxidase [Gilvibacter sediminis]|uniref:cytochrome-c peroxidase n=1 Tax=Gilvibacter sediminis TaxID=379071 RepID=UPI002350CFBD|nr:cytochrome c peroxidase [Gilvibacter sediminis]MDC7997083.1 cytochrome c peroxidase [Gilvibacter sediminis]